MSPLPVLTTWYSYPFEELYDFLNDKVASEVGYLVAGVLVGPNTPGFVADQSLAQELSELGVILLMFALGLEFSLSRFVKLAPTLPKRRRS